MATLSAFSRPTSQRWTTWTASGRTSRSNTGSSRTIEPPPRSPGAPSERIQAAAIIGRDVAASYPRYPASDGIDGLSRWAATLGTTIAASSLGLVALADSGWFRAWLALPVVLGATAGAALVWRPPVRIHFGRPGPAALLCVLVLAVGAALIAPGSENIAGPRDQAVYLATGFAIASGGSTILHDPVLERVVSALGPDEINSWLYSS